MASIELSDQDRKELIEHYSNKIKQLDAEALRLRSLLNKLKNPKTENASQKLQEAVDSIMDNIQGYDLQTNEEKPAVHRQNWKQICLESLKEINAFSSTHDIYNFLVKKQPVFIQYNKDDIVSKISTALSNMYAKGEIRRIKNSMSRGYYWALTDWYATELIGYYKKKLSHGKGVDEDVLFGKNKSP